MSLVNEISGDSVKSAISLKLKSSFAITSGSPPVTVYPTVYKEQIVQKAEPPCFFIWIIDTEQEKIGKNKYKRVYMTNIRYTPEYLQSNSYEQLARIGNIALEALKEIYLPVFTNPVALIRATNMSFKITDNVLQIFATYSFNGKFAEPIAVDMKTLEQDTDITKK